MGDRRRTLNPDSLLRSTIPLPALEEQQRIVYGLRKWWGKVEEVRSLRQKALEEVI
jgi:type I restriction enzyme S subunit